MDLTEGKICLININSWTDYDMDLILNKLDSDLKPYIIIYDNNVDYSTDKHDRKYNFLYSKLSKQYNNTVNSALEIKTKKIIFLKKFVLQMLMYD